MYFYYWVAVNAFFGLQVPGKSPVMRYSFLLLLLLPFLTVAQCEYEMNKVDEFTGKKSILFPKKHFVYGKGLVVRAQLYQVDTSVNIHLHLHLPTVGCMSYDSKVFFKLENGDVVEVPHASDISCGDFPQFYTKFMPEELDRLKASPLQKIRVQGSEGYIDLDVKPKNKNYFVTHVPCLEL